MKFFLITVVSLIALAFSFTLQAQQSQPIQQTLSMIKPDAVNKHHIGEIIAKLEANGLRVAALKMIKLTPAQARAFYAEHEDRPFYPALVAYMTSGPIVVQVLEGVNAVEKYRTIMGATDPSKASSGTIRAEFGTDIERNAVHGSDSATSAQREIRFFFQKDEIY